MGQGNVLYASDGSEPFPYEVDWIASGAVTGPTNQGCKFTCWVFAPIASIEGYIKKKTGVLPKLSEQEVVDNFPENKLGGKMADTFEYVMEKGVHLSRNYPDVGNQKVITIEDYVSYDFHDSDEQQLIKSVTKQPVAIAVFITDKDLASYTPGVSFKSFR